VTVPASAGADLARAPLNEVIAALGTSADAGLSRAEAAARLHRHGPNEVPPQETHPLLTFLGKFWGLSAWMLELMLLLSWALRKHTDVVIIAGLLLLNAVVSFVQEQRAAGAVETLRRRLQVRSRVRRDGAWAVLPARELVPGDIVRLRAGDFVPADLRVVSGTLAVDQSVITGESMDVDRGSGDLLYSGSTVRRGEAGGVVILTGSATRFGRTTELVQVARPRLHSEDVVARVVRWLFAIVGALLAITSAAALLRGYAAIEIAPLMLVLLLSAVPVALPVMFTVSMALGSMELAKKGVLVTRLSASEDAASMDVLCADKTGTITLNRPGIAGVLPEAGFTEGDTLRYGALASEEANQDPIDLAFLEAARARGLIGGGGGPVTVAFTPFDPASRRTEARVDDGGQRWRVAKGAVAAVGAACGLDAAGIGRLETRAREQAEGGYRTLAVARGPEEGPLQLMGLVLLHDTVRPDAAELIGRLGELGVGVKMLTGDALPAAAAIARSVGLGTIRRMADLRAAAGGLSGIDGYAEVYPEDKYSIVRSLQAAGHIVGMTGDGVNDAPALRQAEVGIAVSSATDVAKAAASVVLTAEGLANILSLVEEGRIIHQRILTWILNKISRTILKASFVAAAFLATGKFVISALGMILLVFMTDFAKIALATDRARGSTRPETWEIRGLAGVAAVLGIAMLGEALGLLAIGWRGLGLAGDEAVLRSFSFLTLLYFALFSLVSVRERRRFWRSAPSRTLLLVLVLDGLAGTLLATLGVLGFQRLPWADVAAIFGYAMIACLVVNDALKVALFRRAGTAVLRPAAAPPTMG
jgi:plasma-membrane proton-efflux P-type ATPase